ncbi:MAG: nitroreductase family protein, partial [Erysipelotrichaceae bacterium]|nr:nitroreductase family protein [Erysipelotrichaceae bacterium]
DIISSRSSIRKFTAASIPEDVCRTLIEAGLRAPTATNRQEIHISVTAGSNPIQQEIQNDLKPDAEVNFYFNAPLVFYLSGADDFRWSDVDAGIAVENIHLAAAAMGLGSVILGCVREVLNGEKKAYYDKKLGIQDGYSFRVAIAIGYPDTEKPQHSFDFDRNVSMVG